MIKLVSPAAGFLGEDTGDNLSPSCPPLDASMAGCPDVDGTTLMGSVFFVPTAEVNSASGSVERDSQEL